LLEGAAEPALQCGGLLLELLHVCLVPGRDEVHLHPSVHPVDRDHHGAGDEREREDGEREHQIGAHPEFDPMDAALRDRHGPDGVPGHLEA
jgi:hypothetical protein